MSTDSRTGYEIIYDMLSSAKSHKQLLEAVNKSIPLMKRYNLDFYQREKLEKFGISCYNNIDIAEREISQIQQTNRKN